MNIASSNNNHNNSQSKTLWIGDLQTWMDQSYLNSLIKTLGFSSDLSGIKIIKDKNTNLPAKYGFLQFNSHHTANMFYNSFNGKSISGTNKVFKLNWASYGGGTKPSNIPITKTTSQEISVYVGDLDFSVTQAKLLQYFKQKYPSAYMSKIITDNITKLPKGYGFVKFTNHQQAYKAISQINGTMFQGKIIKVSNAFMKNKEEGGMINQLNQNQAPISQIMKLYQQYYSMLNDPLLKSQYEKQMYKTFGIQQENKRSVREKMQKMVALPKNKTQKSQNYLNSLPRKISFLTKKEMEKQIFG